MDEEKAMTKADREQTPVENAMMQLEEEQGKLNGAILLLAERLKAVLKVPYADSPKLSDVPSKDVESHSQHVRYLSSAIGRSRSAQDVVEYLLTNIEV